VSITNIETVTYGITDFEISSRFWREFGLTPDADEPAVRFSARDGSGIALRPQDDPALPAAIEPGDTAREFTFGVDSPAALDALAAELSRDRDIVVDADGTLHTTDPQGFGIALRVSRRRPVQAPEFAYNTPGRPDRLNTRGQFFDAARPFEMTHAVLMVADPDSVLPFYTERLGFLISDQYPGRGYFLRGGNSIHHHDLFLINVGGKRGFHHVAFELGSIHELFGGGLNMTKRGWTTALGPGRHPISSCYFWYFHCPSGGAAEYDFDSDQVDQNWKPGSFEQTPDNFAEWCLAEGMQETLLYKGIQTAKTAEKK
jgi:catechol 2,3-dioxygenase-like lactoylglutathione lyase family enzyme